MLGPILITASVAFNQDNRSYFPPRGFSLAVVGRGIRSAMAAAAAVQPGTRRRSTALISAAAGVPLAFAFQRYEFPGKALVRAITLGPLILPSLVTGIALLQFLSLIGLGRWMGFWALLIGHVVICLPFSVRTVAISLAAMPGNAGTGRGQPRCDAVRRAAPCHAAARRAGHVRRHDLRLRAQLRRCEPVAVRRATGRTAADRDDPGASSNSASRPTLAAVSIVSMLIPLALVALFGRFVGIGDFLYQETGNG